MHHMFSVTGKYKIKMHVKSNTISRIIKYLWKIPEAGKPVTGKLIQQLENVFYSTLGIVFYMRCPQTQTLPETSLVLSSQKHMH
jgi:hypothetical protein